MNVLINTRKGRVYSPGKGTWETMGTPVHKVLPEYSKQFWEELKMDIVKGLGR